MPITQAEARNRIERLLRQYNALSEQARKNTTEADVVHFYINPLLEALGWPIHDPARYTKELHTEAGRPDITLMPERGGTIFVEAKRFGKIEELRESRTTIAGIVTPGQMALPGMAVDRTPQEQQAINYAFQNGGTWAILTNFERTRLFNARRDWMVLSFERPSAYLDEFDLFWQLSYEQVGAGELDALSNQRHRADVDEAYLQFISLWRERLAQDIIARRADNPWAFDGGGAIDVQAVRTVVQRILDRLVVIRFAEDHLVVPPGTLQSIYELRRNNPYTFPLNESYARMFRVFDELHNSGLFAYGLADQAVIGDEVLAGLTAKLYEARYRALSPDIMGNTYEQYLGKTLSQVGNTVVTTDNLETRKKQGSYYTPQVIVRFLVDSSLGRYLYGTADGRPDGEAIEGERRKTAAEIRTLRVIDPACGSGSFLIYAYEVLAGFYRSELARIEAEREARRLELARQGITMPFDVLIQLAPWTAELERLKEYPTYILENHLYGVDLDPQAAEIATVNLVMRGIADMAQSDRRLPLILNQNVKVGNSLIGVGPGDARLEPHAAALAEIRALRVKLAGESDNDPHDADLARVRELTEQVSAALDATLADQIGDLETHRPFHWAAEFPEVFLGESGNPRGGVGGFEIVVGNPPWEIVKPEIREYYAQFDERIESKYTREQVERRIEELNALPHVAAGWHAQKKRIEQAAAYYRQSLDFGSQGRGDTATHKLFLERCYGLLGEAGRLAFVIPSGIYTDLGTKPLREMLFYGAKVEYLYNFSNERFFFSEVHHGFKFTLLGVQRGEPGKGFWATFRFNPRVAVAPSAMRQFIADSSNLVWIELNALKRFSPDSLSVMEFQTQQDVSIATKMFQFPVMGETEQPWSVTLRLEFHLTNDRHLFNRNQIGLPLLEGRSIHQYEAHYREPEYWIESTIAHTNSRPAPSRGGSVREIDVARLGFREIASQNNARTMIAAIIPPGTCCNHKILVASPSLSTYSTPQMLYLLGVLNSLCMDYLVRFKVFTSVSMFHFYQLPVPRLDAGDAHFDAIVPRAARLTCTTAEFAPLWQEVMGEAWDASKGATDPVERQRLRDELDAIVAHLYGLTRAEFAHALGAFPLVFPNGPQGDAKKAALLRLYDELGVALRAAPP